MKLDPYQEAAIRHKDGPALILAGPGSGKTAVITSRIRYLIEQENIPAEDILAVTFSRKAADHMKDRFLSMHSGKGLPFFGTFHSIFFMILRYAYNLTTKNILKEEQKQDIIHRIAAPFLSETDETADLENALLNEISKVKSRMAVPENYISGIVSPPLFRRIFRAYEDTRKSLGLIDFDDMILLCRKLLSEREDIRSYWQNRFRYILVDEFQDINRIQYECIRILAKPQNNLFAVGDDDQSIYAFRGAEPKIMMRFFRDYPDAARITLCFNYRCGKVIRSSAGKVIRENKSRFPKDVKSALNVPSGLFQIRKCKNRKAEYEAIASDIKKKIQTGTDPRQIAILARTSLEFPMIQNSLRAKGITADLGVFLMTMHAAKGLEFQHVYIPDANEGICPSLKTKTRGALEEERRIFYVAMTRASHSLKVYFSETIRSKKAAPSRFLSCFLDPH